LDPRDIELAVDPTGVVGAGGEETENLIARSRSKPE
jgi:hypothetical protein